MLSAHAKRAAGYLTLLVFFNVAISDTNRRCFPADRFKQPRHRGRFHGTTAMNRIRRHYTPGCFVFLTLVCVDRAPLLASPANKRTLVKMLVELRHEHGFRLYAWVILDDHLHLLVSDPRGGVSRWIQQLKLRFARSQWRTREHVWQHRYWDHLIRDETDLHRHLDYIHWNPVKHGYAATSAQYPWSSFRSFVRRGIYLEDWVYRVERDEWAAGEAVEVRSVDAEPLPESQPNGVK